MLPAQMGSHDLQLFAALMTLRHLISPVLNFRRRRLANPVGRFDEPDE
jgi:hypothetical protein